MDMLLQPRPRNHYQELLGCYKLHHCSQYCNVDAALDGGESSLAAPATAMAQADPPAALGHLEKLFDKVVTQSDIKQYRLTLPKKQARKHFPLNVGSASGSVLLWMEDREGKRWKFRYTFWKSTRSYVLTSEWNQFVNAKGLSAGDVVSFLRSPGPAGSNMQLYITWDPQPSKSADTPSFQLLHHHHHHHHHQHHHTSTNPNPNSNPNPNEPVMLFGVNISTNIIN